MFSKERSVSLVRIAVAMAVGVFTAGSAHSALVFEGVGAGPLGDLRAEAIFDIITPGTLQVNLTNTSTADVWDPNFILTALFFNVEGASGAMTPLTASLEAGSSVFFPPATDVDGNPLTDGTYPGGDVSAEWAFRSDLVGAPGDAAYGVSAAWLGFFGVTNLFDPTHNLFGPEGPNGLNYGLTSMGDDPSTGWVDWTVIGDHRITGRSPLIQSGVALTFDVADDFDLSSIDDVSFQYGIRTYHPNIIGQTVVPEPSTLLLLGGSLAAFAFRRFRKAQ